MTTYTTSQLQLHHHNHHYEFSNLIFCKYHVNAFTVKHCRKCDALGLFQQQKIYVFFTKNFAQGQYFAEEPGSQAIFGCISYVNSPLVLVLVLIYNSNILILTIENSCASSVRTSVTIHPTTSNDDCSVICFGRMIIILPSDIFCS